MRPEQAEAAKLIVAWGNNVTWTNLHLVPIINGVRRAGGKLIIVDPKRTKIAAQADLHVAGLSSAGGSPVRSAHVRSSKPRRA